MIKMTRKELNEFLAGCDKVVKGYCCYQDAGLSKWDLKEIGYNHGVYGWNWTLYLDTKTNTAYVSGYRNY